jgi:MraZ protein
MRLFTGTFTHALDAKNRVSVPRKMLDVLRQHEGGGSEVVLTVGFDGCLYLYPPEEFVRLGEAITSGSLGDEMVRDLGRTWFGQAEVCPVDKNGRMLVPDGLKRRIGLKDKVVFAGAGSRVELWTPAAHEERSTSAFERYPDQAREVLG